MGCIRRYKKKTATTTTTNTNASKREASSHAIHQRRARVSPFNINIHHCSPRSVQKSASQPSSSSSTRPSEQPSISEEPSGELMATNCSTDRLQKMIPAPKKIVDDAHPGPSDDAANCGTAPPSCSEAEGTAGANATPPDGAQYEIKDDEQWNASSKENDQIDSAIQLVGRSAVAKSGGNMALNESPASASYYLASSSPGQLELAKELRESINGSLLNCGVLAALMMALAGAIYTEPPEPPGECFGESGLHAEMVITWMAMGFFFFSTISTVVLYMDIDGIPTHLLLNHLYSGQVLYSLPHLATALGIFMTAIAYAVDIGERGGCPFFYFGIVAAPCFVFSIVALWFVCRWRRQKLFRELAKKGNATNRGRRGGVAYLATWADRVPLKDGIPSR